MEYEQSREQFMETGEALGVLNVLKQMSREKDNLIYSSKGEMGFDLLKKDCLI